MVPLDGFGLVCNIFQAISFTREVFHQVKDIVNQGRSDYDGDLISSKIERLTAFCDKIGEKTIPRLSLSRKAHQPAVTHGLAFTLPQVFAIALPGTWPSARDRKEDLQLLRVAEKCRTATEEFLAVISGLELPSGKGDAMKAFKIWVKMAWNKRKITKLEKCVREHEKLLDSVILKRLLTKAHAIDLQQRSDFARLDTQVQNLVGLILDGQMDIKALVAELSSAMARRIERVAQEVKSAVAADGQAIRGHFDAAFRQAEQRQHEMCNLDQELKSFDKLLHSVHSETANIRQIEVADAHETTYKWVFDPGKLAGPHDFSISFEPEDDTESDSWSDEETGSDEDEDTSVTHLCNKSTGSQMDCFLCWLSSPQAKPYWVCGKPGSGKSTLMKYIATSPRTRSTLKDVYGSDALILSHFIYLHGEEDQRSREGILLTLAHQYLSRISGNAAERQSIQGVFSALQHQIPDIFLRRTSSEWSYGELETLLLALLESSQRKVVIFIDGLDEVKVERQMAPLSPVLGLVDKLCRLPRVHVCVSSRPEQVFVNKFTEDAHLTLQELTRHDISKYVTDHLRQFYIKDQRRRRFLEDLVEEVWKRSDGVFLWACMVTKSLAKALSNRDDDQMIRERLKELPRDVNNLYQAMLERLKDDKIYQPYAATYLQAVLSDHTAVLGRESCIITDLFSEDEVKKMLKTVISDPKCRYTWARSECEKLAEVVPLRTSYLVEVDGLEVRLLHRSAADFLETPGGQEILKHHKLSEEAETALYLWRTLLFVALQGDKQDFLFTLGGFIWLLEDNVFDSQPQLAMSLSLFCQRLYYSRMRRDSPASLVFPDVLKIGYCFNSFLARLDVPKLLFCAMTIDIGSSTMTPGSLQDDWLSQRRLPLVYSPDYLLFLAYQSLVGVGIDYLVPNDKLRPGFYYVNSESDTYSWLMRNICLPATSQQMLKPYVSLASIILTSFQWKKSSTRAAIKALHAALDMEGAWDEKPICTLSISRGNVYLDVYGLHQGMPTLTPPSEAGYVMQATTGFLVHLFLAQLHRTSSGGSLLSDPLVSSLRDEINKRCPSGIPAAAVFAGFQTSRTKGHLTRTLFTLSPDHLLHISMPQYPRETSLVFQGKCLGLKDLDLVIYQAGEFFGRGNVFRKQPVPTSGSVKDYQRACISALDITEKEPEETSGDFGDGGKEWFSRFVPRSGFQSIIPTFPSKSRADFFDTSSLDRQVVSEEAFLQEVSKWRQTAFDGAE